MSGLGKTLVLMGIALTLTGVFVWSGGRFLPRRMPGDIVIERDNLRIYFPLGWCIVVSLVLSAIGWLLRK